MFDKPDLLKASEPSLSLHSFNNEFGEYTDVARYIVSQISIPFILLTSHFILLYSEWNPF